MDLASCDVITISTFPRSLVIGYNYNAMSVGLDTYIGYVAHPLLLVANLTIKWTLHEI